jgi:hypothetical protein
MNKKQASEALRKATVAFGHHRYGDDCLLELATHTCSVSGNKLTLYLECLPVNADVPEMGYQFSGRIEIVNDWTSARDETLWVNLYKMYTDLGEVIDELKGEYADWYEDKFGVKDAA